ncbi:hypothetical protein FRC12_000946 [Ceratobasidium sp. 428]|nr:hypothetical protein FRC12_000946 [Ceratobasidium sp. 428]
MTYNLPPELLLRLLIDPRSMAALASINKYYNHVITPILYGNISLSGSCALTSFSRTMATGRPSLREYPRSLHLQDIYQPGTLPLELQSAIKELLMHVPNVVNLSLTFEPRTTINLIRGPRYPFRLRRLELVPPTDPLFIELLKTQPMIEHIVLWGEPSGRRFYNPPYWATEFPLNPQILPNLKTIWSDRFNANILVPNRPVTHITMFRSQGAFDFHTDIAKTSAPLEYLSEHIELRANPWEANIASRCFPTLSFCHQSLIEYSLHVTFDYQYALNELSISRHLGTSKNPSFGFAKIRECLSAFSRLRKFKLQMDWDYKRDLISEFSISIPELSQFERWKESCPTLEEVNIFGLILRS